MLGMGGIDSGATPCRKVAPLDSLRRGLTHVVTQLVEVDLVRVRVKVGVWVRVQVSQPS